MLLGRLGAKNSRIVIPGGQTSAFKELGLLTLSAVLFCLSFPNPLSDTGFGFLAWIALFPAFIVINSCPWKRLFLYGPYWGFASYALFNYWLAVYHPLAILIVPSIYMMWYLVIVLLMRLTAKLLPNWGFVVQAMLWVVYEYAKTQGFLGYPYGILAYSQYQALFFVQSAAIWGPWGISLLLVFPSLMLAWFWRQKDHSAGLKTFLLKRWIFAALWLLALGFSVVAGRLSQVDFTDAPRKNLLLIQQNFDPWKVAAANSDPAKTTAAYQEGLDKHIRQTEAGLSAHPETDMVLWSETSIIPAIRFHYQYRVNEDRFQLVKNLLDYLATVEVPVLLGNGDAQAYRDQEGRLARRDYNAAMLYEKGQLKSVYHKIHLVPFTEHFPYADTFPWIKQLLEDNNTTVWNEGKEYVIMEAAGFKFGTPICFEDTFGQHSREFAARGADMIVNISNDSWSQSVPGAMQHMAIAIFRAIENRLSVVRSTNGGMSGLIDPDGHIVLMNKPFTESYLLVNAPLVKKQVPTFYQTHGDFLAIILVIAALLLLIAAACYRLAQVRKVTVDS